MAYETKVTTQKKESVETLKNEFSLYNGYVFTDYRGLTVEQMKALRKNLLSLDSSLRVIKNRYAKIAFKELGTEVKDEDLKGPVAVAYVKGDKGNEVAKTLFKVASDTGKFSVKSAILDGEYFDSAKIEAYSKLPTRNELLASLMGTMKAPIQKLAATLKALEEKLSQGGSVATETVAPAQEEPKAEEAAPVEAPSAEPATTETTEEAAPTSEN